jgi:hypothetical protein
MMMTTPVGCGNQSPVNKGGLNCRLGIGQYHPIQLGEFWRRTNCCTRKVIEVKQSRILIKLKKVIEEEQADSEGKLGIGEALTQTEIVPRLSTGLSNRAEIHNSLRWKEIHSFPSLQT